MPTLSPLLLKPCFNRASIDPFPRQLTRDFTRGIRLALQPGDSTQRLPQAPTAEVTYARRGYLHTSKVRDAGGQRSARPAADRLLPSLWPPRHAPAWPDGQRPSATGLLLPPLPRVTRPRPGRAL